MKKHLLLLAVILTACSAQEEPEKKAPEGRAETRSIRNTGAVGYSGSEIADKVDGALNANDERIRQQEKETEAPAE